MQCFAKRIIVHYFVKSGKIPKVVQDAVDNSRALVYNECSVSKRQKSLFAADNSAVQKPKAAFATTFIATEIDKFHFEICLPNFRFAVEI